MASGASSHLLASSSQRTLYDGSSFNKDAEEPVGNSRFFPMEPFKSLVCLPPFFVEMIPGHLKKLQSWSHLVLALGVLTSLMMLVDTLASWALRGCRTSYCQGRIFPLCFVSCCLVYFVKTVAQFDENLIVKQKEIQKAKEELGRRYQETVAELDACIAKSMDAQATLAERSFDAKRRDFQRVLVKVARDCGSLATGLAEFRGFVLLWLQVFSECSINPVTMPLQIATASELQRCGKVSELAELLAERLKATQVKFISRQLDKDKEELGAFQKVWSALTLAQDEQLKKKRQSVKPSSKALKDLEEGTLSFQGSFNMEDESKEDESRRWFQKGTGGRTCGVDGSKADESGFPAELNVGCCRAIFLSAEHVQLMMAFVFGWLVLYIEFFVVELSKWVLELNVSVCLVCIVFVLYEFVDIDIVQQLEAQLREVQAEKDKLEAKRKAMFDFYDRSQILADVWLHRTVPRLELLKQFSEEIQDSLAEGGTVISEIAEMNAQLADLEGSLPKMELWLSEEVMEGKLKKQLGEAMTELTRASSTKAALAMMPRCCNMLAGEQTKLQQKALEGKAAEA